MKDVEMGGETIPNNVETQSDTTTLDDRNEYSNPLLKKDGIENQDLT